MQPRDRCIYIGIKNERMREFILDVFQWFDAIYIVAITDILYIMYIYTYNNWRYSSMRNLILTNMQMWQSYNNAKHV
jgi:hypothetical protein